MNKINEQMKTSTLETNKIFWTNQSEDKPSREFLNALNWEDEIGQNFELVPNVYGKATIVSTVDNINGVKFRDQIYLVNNIVPQNNNLFKYELEIDVWSVLTLPFLELRATLYPLRSHIEQLYAPILQDPLMDSLPKTYLPFKSYFTDVDVPYESIWTWQNEENPAEYKDFEKITMNWVFDQYDPGSIYFIFDSTTKIVKDTAINFDSNIQNMIKGSTRIKSPLILDPFVAIPVLNSTGYTDGTKEYSLFNNFEYLTKLTQRAELGQFKGIFQGPPMRYKTTNFTTSSIPSATPEEAGYDWFINHGQEKLLNDTEQRPVMFTFVGYNTFAKFKTPDLKTLNLPLGLERYVNVYLGNENWENKNYYLDEQQDIQCEFNGSTFTGFIKDTKTSDFNSSMISWGSYLISSTDSYSNYMSANKSQQNAGLLNSLQGGIFGGIAGLAGGGIKHVNNMPGYDKAMSDSMKTMGKEDPFYSSNTANVRKGLIDGAAAEARNNIHRENVVSQNIAAMGKIAITSGIGAAASLVVGGSKIGIDRAAQRRLQHQVVQTSDVRDNMSALINASYDDKVDPFHTKGSLVYKVQMYDSPTRSLLEEYQRRYGWVCNGVTTFAALTSKDVSYFELDMDLLETEITSSGIALNKQDLILKQLSYGIRVWKKGK